MDQRLICAMQEYFSAGGRMDVEELDRLYASDFENLRMDRDGRTIIFTKEQFMHRFRQMKAQAAVYEPSDDIAFLATTVYDDHASVAMRRVKEGRPVLYNFVWRLPWVRTHGTEYAADTRTLFVAGGSAGAQLAAQAAMTQNNKTLQPGFETADTSMTAAVLLYGYYGWSESESWKRIHAADYAIPPVFMAHGDHDTLTPVEDARAFAEKLRAISNNPVVLAELPGAQHSFDLFHSIRSEAAIDAIEYFAAWVRSNQRGNRAGSAGA